MAGSSQRKRGLGQPLGLLGLPNKAPCVLEQQTGVSHLKPGGRDPGVSRVVPPEPVEADFCLCPHMAVPLCVCVLIFS